MITLFIKVNLKKLILIYFVNIILYFQLNYWTFFFSYIKLKLYVLIVVDIIHDLIKHRLDSYDVKNIEKPEKLFKEIESVTSSPDPKTGADSQTTDS